MQSKLFYFSHADEIFSLNYSLSPSCQKAGPWIPQVLRDQLPLELLPMVLHRRGRLRIRSVPYFWAQSLEANVIILSFPKKIIFVVINLVSIVQKALKLLF